MARQKKTDTDRRIEASYYRSCSGIQIPMMAIPKVYDQARFFLASNTPVPTDDELDAFVRAYVETIRVND